MQRVAEKRANAGTGSSRSGTNGFALYSDPRTSNSGGAMDPLFAGWSQFLQGRADIKFTTLAKGGRFNRHHLQKKAGQFRDAFAYGDDVEPDVHALMQNSQFYEAALRIHPGCIVEPGIMFANFFVPGEVQAIHTDVPEFRGCNRTNCPEWMLVCMHHSGLFKRWYVPIATAISWYSNHTGGELAFYADPDIPAVVHPTAFNSALVLDTDSVYHGVDPVGGQGVAPPVVPQDSLLAHKGGGRWCVTSMGKAVSGYEDLTWSDLRMSVQWKAYCFANETARAAFKNHTDDLAPVDAWRLMVDVLVAAGKVDKTESYDVLAQVLCSHFIRVPRELQTLHEPQAVLPSLPSSKL